MKRYGYLVVEGPHDIEFAARLLREYGLRRITYKRYLEPFWEAVIPKIFPINDNLLKRVPVPVFLENISINQSELSIGCLYESKRAIPFIFKTL